MKYTSMVLALVLALLLVGLTGCQGPTGNEGLTGAPGQSIVGPQGPAGAPGTSITIVQFCPGQTAYPSQFNEIGFCVGNQVYGTYSANGGFSSLLPPGAYTSNGIGSSCNFTILPNCLIQ